jgi:hypothetical protein
MPIASGLSQNSDSPPYHGSCLANRSTTYGMQSVLTNLFPFYYHGRKVVSLLRASGKFNHCLVEGSYDFSRGLFS